MTDLIGIRPTDKRFLNIIWVTSNLCNYRCGYCAENNYGGSNLNISDTHLDNCKRLIEDVCQQYPDRGFKMLRVFFGGGEPTYWKPFIPMVDHLKETFDKSQFEDLSIGLNTNLSSKIEWWEQNWKYFDHMSASFHIEHADQDAFIENLKFLQDKFVWTVRLMMHDERFQEVVDFGERIKSELDGYRLEYVPLLTELSNRGVPYEYKEQWKKDFFETADRMSKVIVVNNPNKPFDLTAMYEDHEEHLDMNKVFRKGQNNFSGWKCHVEDLISIMHNGEVSDVTCGQGHFLGNLNDGPIKLESEPVWCTKDFCHCGSEAMLPKFKGEDLLK